MGMRKTLCLCATLGTAMGAAAPAMAQLSGSSVTIYGVLDLGVEYVRGVPTTGGGTGGQFREGYGGSPSRIGFKGREDLGGGLAAEFLLETGMMMDTGAWSQGRMFGRQSWVGLTGDFGSVSVGRQNTMRYYGMLDADLFAAASQGLGALDSGIPNARADNSISWRSKPGTISGGLNYSFGRDTVATNNPTGTNCPGETTDTKQCREYSGMIKYDAGTWGLVSAYERINGGTSATYGGLTSPNLTDTRITVNAYANFGDTKLGGGWLGRNNQGSTTPKSDLYWVVAARPVSERVVLDGMAAMIKYQDSPNKAVLLVARATYLLSKRTSLYLSLAAVSNSGTLAAPVSTNPPGTVPNPGSAQQSIMAGIKHTF